MGGFVKGLSTHLTWKKIKFVFLLVFFKSSVLNVLCQDETIDMDCKKMRRCYTSLRTLFLLVPSSNGFILTGNFYHHICLISKGNFNSLLTIYFQSQAIKFDCHILAYTVAFTMIFWQAKYIFIHEIFVGKY